MLEGIVHEAVDLLLVDVLPAVLALDGGPAHAAVSEQSDTLGTLGHLSFCGEPVPVAVAAPAGATSA